MKDDCKTIKPIQSLIDEIKNTQAIQEMLKDEETGGHLPG